LTLQILPASDSAPGQCRARRPKRKKETMTVTYQERAEKIVIEIERMTGASWAKGFIQKVNEYVANEIAAQFYDDLDIKITKEREKVEEIRRADKIRDAFQANYRAALNMLASMTAEERKCVLVVPATKDATPSQILYGSGGESFQMLVPTYYARHTAREACVATWGANAVKAALGGGS
jgi:hypothetical protein